MHCFAVYSKAKATRDAAQPADDNASAHLPPRTLADADAYIYVYTYAETADRGDAHSGAHSDEKAGHPLKSDGKKMGGRTDDCLPPVHCCWTEAIVSRCQSSCPKIFFEKALCVFILYK